MNKNTSRLIIFLLHLLALVLYRLLGYSGHFGYDDMEYAEVAYQLSQGVIDFDNHFFYRFAIVVPTAISYMLFGVNDIASSIPPMIASGLVLYLVFRFMKNHSPRSIALALSATLFSEWFLFYGNKLMVDIYVCLAVVFIIYVIYNCRLKKTKHSTKYAFLFALGFIYGFMAKGTIILILPLLTFFFIYDFIQRKHLRFWGKSIIFSILLFSLYFLFMQLLSGDFSSRFSAINANQYINPCSYGAQPISVVLSRITFGFLEMIRNEGYAFSFAFIVAALLFRRKLNFFKINYSTGFFLSSCFFLFLSSNFMSISLTSYNPMCLDFRHYLWLVPITAVTLARLTTETKGDKKFQFTLLLLLSILTISTYFSDGKLFLGLYLPMLALYTVFTIHSSKLFNNTLFPLFFSIIFLIQPVRISINAQQSDYVGQVEYIKEQLITPDQKRFILTDKVQARIGNYLSGYNQRIQFLPFDSIQRTIGSNIERKVLVNPYTQFFAGVKDNGYPFYVQNIIKNNPPILEKKELGVKIYDAPSISDPKLTGELLYSAFTSFEKEVYTNWNINKDEIIDSIAYHSKHSNKVAEYSGTFRVLLDSLPIDSSSKLYVEVSAYTYLKEATNASLVISVVNVKENLFWESFEINKFHVVYSNWWETKAFASLDTKLLTPNSELVVYFWNKDKEFVLLDNFEVKLFNYKD